jgi:hypothetical protein
MRPRDFCTFVNEQMGRRARAVIPLFFRSLRRRRSRIPAPKEHLSLIISCKNSKNSGGLFENGRLGKTCAMP